MQNGLSNNFDAIIIGSGIGGLITGAILAEKENWKILMLEKEDVIGGKIYAFEHYDGDEKTFLRRLYRNARAKVIKSDPPISELIEKKTFSRFIFEAGWHSFIAGDRSRLTFLASSLGADLKIHPNRGFQLFADGEWQDLRYLMKNWTPEDFKEGKTLSRKMNLMSLEESNVFDNIDLRSFLNSQTKSQNVRDFHEWLAGYESGLNDPTLISAGEHIKVISMVHCAGRDFEFGGGGQPAGGFNAMSRLFAGIIEKNGGIIRTETPVGEIIVENYKAVGVRTPDGDVQAPRIICNVPMQRALPLLEDEYWPAEFKLQIAKTQPLAGIEGWINLKRPLHPDFKGIFVLPVLPGCRDTDGFRGNALFTFEDIATYDETRAPEGEGLMTLWVGLLPHDPDEINNTTLTDKVVNSIFSFFNENYPDFEENINWYFVTAHDELYSNSMTPGMVGDRRLPVKHPLVHELFFTGDSVAQWSFGVSGAAGGAVNCASAASGRDYSVLLPFYMR